MDTEDSVQLFSVSVAPLPCNQYFLLSIARISNCFYAVHHTSMYKGTDEHETVSEIA